MQKTVIMLFVVFLFLSAAYLDKKSEKDKYHIKLSFSNGQMTKLQYEDHSYVSWTCNFGCSLTHDPNCICYKKKD